MDKNLRRKSIKIIDEKNDVIIPIIVGKISIIYEVRYILNKFTNPDNVIAGIPTRKDNLAAVFLSIPENKAEVKVTPDLETPGIIARACEVPNKIMSISLISLNNFFLEP